MYFIHENEQHSFFPESKNNLGGPNNQTTGFVTELCLLILLSYFSWKSAFIGKILSMSNADIHVCFEI